jgi:hypothetical protein
MSLNKICSVCKTERPLSDFPVRRASKDGHGSYCKSCSSAKDKKYYKNNKEHILTKVAEYQKKNPDKARFWKRKHAGYNFNKNFVKNFFIIREDTVEMHLTQGYTTLLDFSDWINICGMCWSYQHQGYAQSNDNSVLRRLHREILGYSRADHANRNKLDNRRCNLRPASPTENGRNKGPQSNNKSGFKGVYWSTRDKVWIARIRFEGKDITLGYFDNAAVAAKAYDLAAKEYFGEFAYLNFPKTSEESNNVFHPNPDYSGF